jgi:hypothetical protein
MLCSLKNPLMGITLQSRHSGRLRGNNVTDCTVRETALNKVMAPTEYKHGGMFCVFTAYGRIGTGL